MKASRKLLKFIFRRRELKAFSRCLLFFLLHCSFSNGNTQWRKLSNIPIQFGTVYFQHNVGRPNVGFVGTFIEESNGNRDHIGQLWKTNDGGSTWNKVSDDSWFGAVRDIYFKDSLTGWIATGYLNNRNLLGGACYRTIDGGDNWQLIVGSEGHASSIYYSRLNNALLIGYWDRTALKSFDDGLTFQSFPTLYNCNGFSFWNDYEGIMTRVSTPGPNFFPIFITRDGGMTWSETPLAEEIWQPLAIEGTSTAFFVCEYFTNKLYRSDDNVFSWNELISFGEKISGCIRGSIDKLFIQTNRLTLSSNDAGNSWFSICGPGNLYDTRFFYYQDTLISGDRLGNIWMNVTGKGSGTRLSVSKNSNRTLSIDQLTPIDIFYPNESNYEAVDSVCFTLNLKGELMGYELDSVADGWRVKRRSITDSTIKYCLERTTSDTVAYNSLILRLYLKAYLTRDTTAQITLDEVNFNQDVTFRDCMIPTLSATDTVNFLIHDECGDSTLRTFLNSKPVLELLSIFPNPTSGDVTVSYSTLLEHDINLQVSDFIGKIKIEETLSPKIGVNNYTIPIPSNYGGSYYVRLQMGKDVVTGKFVKQ